jgi:2'-5' RNA ligase
VSSIRARLPRSAWVGRDAYHLTFAFLGDQEPDVVTRIAAALKEATGELARLDARLAGAGFFPGERNPRVAWIAVEPHERVIAIADAVRGAIAAAGVRFDPKPFKAHLTLARIRDEWKARDATQFVEAVGAGGAISFRLDRVSLFESQLLPSGAVHTELASSLLA